MKKFLKIVITFFLIQNILTQDVHTLTQNNYETIFSSFDYVLVDFFLPWCPACQKLGSELANAASRLKKLKKSIALAQVNANENPFLVQKYSISEYPTLKFFAMGIELPYKGGDTEDEIYKWMRFRAMASTKILNTMEHLEDATEINDMIIIYFGDKGHSFEIYEKVTKTYDNLNFAHYFDENSENKVTIHIKDVTFVYNPETFDFLELRSFINRHQLGVILPLDKYNAFKIFEVYKPGLVVLLDDSIKSDQVLENLKTVLNENYEIKEKFLSFYGDYKEEYPKIFMDLYGIKIEDLPQIRIVIPQNEKSKNVNKYEPLNQNNYSTSSILTFCKMFLSNSLKKVLKSEPIPNNQNENVKVLVGRTFEKIVYDETKDVLVEFYAPWCHHCQQFEPTYRDLAEKVSSNPNIIIAKIDITKNEVENIAINSYPSLKLFPAKNKNQPIDFTGNRHIPILLEFLKANANLELPQGLVQEEKETVRTNSDGVIVLTQSNFEEIVLKSDKHVLLDIFAEECGYCKQLEPAYNRLPKEIKKLGYDILITKIDGLKHKIPNISFKGFPTILLLKKDNKKDTILYQGDRSLKDFIKFIKDNCYFESKTDENNDEMIKVDKRNFKENVYNEKNDFILFIYRNNLDKSLNQIVKKLKEEFKNSDYKNINFGQIDIDNNPIPDEINYQLNFDNLPIIAIFIKQYKKSPTQYYGNLNDINEIQKFIIKESSFTIIQGNPNEGNKQVKCNENQCKEEL